MVNKKNVKLVAYKWLHLMAIFVSIFLIISISLETFRHEPFLSRSIYFQTQFWICIYFTIDFFLLFYLAENKSVFVKRYFMLLVLSIPYLTLVELSGIQLNDAESYLIRFIPLLRGGAAIVMLLAMILKRNISTIFVSYLVLLVSIAYFMTLIFFEFEEGVNPLVKSYGDTIWWAAMTVTTLGSNIIPLTVAGKIATTVLAALGMTIFPIFTAYITMLINKLSQSKSNTVTS